MVAIAERDAAEPHRRLLQTMIDRETFAAACVPCARHATRPQCHPADSAGDA
jgi:hypothetical protein